MMLRVAVVLTLSFLGFCLQSCTTQEQTLVERYFSQRDKHIAELEAQGLSADERPALLELENRLHEIVGGVRVEGFQGRGKINLATLYRELGFGLLDGLQYRTDKELLVISTQQLLNGYLANASDLPKGMNELAMSEEFFSVSLDRETFITKYMDLPVKSAPDSSVAHAFLGLATQDIGPFVPDSIYVFLTNGDYVFLAMSELDPALDGIVECQDIWNMYQAKSGAAFERYKASNLEDKIASDEMNMLDVDGHSAFVKCYGDKLKVSDNYSGIVKQAQSVVYRLQNAKLSSLNSN